VLLGEIHVPGIQIAEKKLTPAELEDADEVFITSTTRSLLPVREIEGKKVGRTDQTWRTLSAAFGEYVDRYVAGHKATAV
jgi:branched-chain amino acid aminotransferase